MNTIEMAKFGRTLTDRPYGQQISEKIVNTEHFPIALDFKGVISLGSSFGDELLSALGPKQENNVVVFNVNDAVRSCLEKVSLDLGVNLDFQ